MMTDAPVHILTFERNRGTGHAGTGIVAVRLASSGVQIGVIRWHRPYRQYAFKPDDADRLYTASVLLEIRRHLKSMMRAWKKHGPREEFTKGNYAEVSKGA